MIREGGRDWWGMWHARGFGGEAWWKWALVTDVRITLNGGIGLDGVEWIQLARDKHK
jgi:hypothetical protein